MPGQGLCLVLQGIYYSDPFVCYYLTSNILQFSLLFLVLQGVFCFNSVVC